MITLITESGSKYEIDAEAKQFRKVETAGGSWVNPFPWREYTHIEVSPEHYAPFVETEPEDIKIGAEVFFHANEIIRWVKTSPVVEVLK
jgi:hypothetical protein